MEITPKVGGELSGFAARMQPSVGVLDPLYARALYVEAGNERVLWLHLDLIGLGRATVEELRRCVHARFGRAEDRLMDRVMISTTHTHAGPPTVVLHEAGTYDPAYVHALAGQLQDAAAGAVECAAEIALACVEGRCDLAVDRRRRPSAHTDPRVAAVGFRRPDGSFAAVLVNYAMHAVALGPTNRCISADWPGRTAATLAHELPGDPVVLVTNGACGNLNPPFENVSVEQLDAWGTQVASAVSSELRAAPPIASPLLRVDSRLVELPLDVLSVEQIEACAERSLENLAGVSEWGDKFRRAIGAWRRNMVESVQSGVGDSTEMELFAVRLADRVFTGVNAEVFSTFTGMLRNRTGANVYTVGYANGLIGYLPTEAAYDEGGYEVEMAHLFYNRFRPRRGGLERLAEHAVEQIRAVTA